MAAESSPASASSEWLCWPSAGTSSMRTSTSPKVAGGKQCFGRPVLGVDRAPAIPLPQLGVVEHLAETLHLCGGHTGSRQAGVELFSSPALGVRGDHGIAFVAISHPCHIGGETGIAGQLRLVEHVGDQCAPATVVLPADEDFAVACRVGVVGGNRTVAQAHSRQLGSRCASACTGRGPSIRRWRRAWRRRSWRRHPCETVAVARRGPPGMPTCRRRCRGWGCPS